MASISPIACDGNGNITLASIVDKLNEVIVLMARNDILMSKKHITQDLHIVLDDGSFSDPFVRMVRSLAVPI